LKYSPLEYQCIVLAALVEAAYEDGKTIESYGEFNEDSEEGLIYPVINCHPFRLCKPFSLGFIMVDLAGIFPTKALSR